ncbi:MAG: peptide ABC transporter substrate-binding protein [Clostridia bacterium]|nr:peptide ABC transporter substrate-binding protein [Clostridia bacterium]
MKKFLSLVMALVMVLCCVPALAEAPAYDGPDTYSMIANFDITTLDYVYNNKASNGDYTSNFIEGLLTQDSHGILIPGMAKEWYANEDASEWTFIIRDDAVWSTNSGEEYDAVVAEDFVTGLKHAADSKSETLGLVADLIVGLRAYSEGTGTWEDVGIKADGNVLTYTLTDSCGYFDGMTTYSILWPINAEFLESKGADFGAVSADSILYNGCYILSSLVPAQEVRFDANPNYYDKDNVFVQHVVVSYTDGQDPAQNFNMFVNGEVTSTTVNQSLPDVVAKANELYADNQYISMTTATSYWGAFNWDRRMYNLYNDPSVSTTSKTTDEQKADTKAAILNANFRRAVYAAYSAHAVEAITLGEELADGPIRNTLVPYTFATTSDGRAYGSIVTKYAEELVPEYAGIDLNDGHDAWYDVERAKVFIEKAKEELGDTISEWPIHLDVPVYAANENQKNMQLAMQNAIESAIGDYVKIDLQFLEGNSSVYYSAFYNQPTGEENSIDLVFGAGWGPDYGDPLTYIHCFDIHDGDMLNYSGINYESQGQDAEQKAVLKTLGLEDIQAVVDQAVKATGDERIELFAKAEAMLLTGGILRPYSTRGANVAISKVKPFSSAYGMYGQGAYNQVPYFKYMQLLDEPVTTAEYNAAKEAWLAGE